MSDITNIPISEIPLRGPDLTFIVLPAILDKMPFSNFWAVIFFITMIFLGKINIYYYQYLMNIY